METKNFLGLDGLNHFWEKAKVWIINEITTKIAGIVLSSVPTGTVLSGLYTTTPDGFLLCDGKAYLKTTYPELFAVIGTLFNLPTDGDAVFRVPDLRELVLVGSGISTRAEIATHDVYTLGEFKDDQLQQHTHTYANPSLTTDVPDLVPGIRICSASVPSQTYGCSGRTGTTTHGKQIGVNYIIKY